MNVAYNESQLKTYLSIASKVSPDHPTVITKFIEGAQELDVDAVAHDGNLLVYAVSQHIENAGIIKRVKRLGVHSGDATLVLPPLIEGRDAPVDGVRPLNDEIVFDSKVIAEKIAKYFQISGPFNMQLILTKSQEGKHDLSIIECNLRASRSFPFVSKVLNANFIDLATKAIVNAPTISIPEVDLMLESRDFKAVKVPIFSWTRLSGADPSLGVEMASTGEVACFGKNIQQAFYTAHEANHTNFKSLPLPLGSSILLSGDEFFFEDLEHLSHLFHSMGYKILVYSPENHLKSPFTPFDLTILDDPKKSQEAFKSISLVISLFKTKDENAYLIRRNAVDFGVGLLNERNISLLFAQSLKQLLDGEWTINDVVKSHEEFLK